MNQELMEPFNSFESRNKRGWFRLVGGILLLLLLVAMLLALLFPVIGRRNQKAMGERCNENLELIFQAKEEMAKSLELDPFTPHPKIVYTLEPKDLAPFLKKHNRDLSCPAGGTYKIRPLVDDYGEVIPPVCSCETEDPDGNGKTNAEEGYHIHWRSHLKNPESGWMFREPEFRFPD